MEARKPAQVGWQLNPAKVLGAAWETGKANGVVAR